MFDPDREPQYDARAEAGMLELAEKPDLESQRGAAYCLGDVSAPGMQTMRTLLRLCASSDEQTASAALQSVAQIAARYPEPPVDVLVEAARSESPAVRRAAAHGMGNMQKVTEAQEDACVTSLLELLRDPETQAAACENIGFFHSQRNRSTPALLEVMKGEMSDDAREAAIQSLGNSYLNDLPAPAEVLAGVRAATSHAHPKVAAIARWAVACLDRAPSSAKPPASASASQGVKSKEELLAQLEDLRKRAEALQNRIEETQQPPPGVNLRLYGLIGGSLAAGGATFFMTHSIGYAVLAVLGAAVAIMAILLAVVPADPLHKPGTRAFEAFHTAQLLEGIIATRRSELDRAPASEHGRRTREIEFLEKQLHANQEIVALRDASPGQGYIGFKPYEGE